MFQVFELGLLGLKAEIVDTMRVPGGQCAELYPDKPIYDIPGIPVCSGEELVDSLLKQIEPFDAGMHLGQEVQRVEPRDGGRFYVATSEGTEFDAGSVVVAGGVGSFQPRRVRVEGADVFEGHSLHYSVKQPERFAGKRVIIFGGGDSALDWTLALVDKVGSLALVHRRDEYRAMEASVAAMRELVAAGKVALYEKTKLAGLKGEGTELAKVTLAAAEGDSFDLEVDQMLVFFGLAPKLGPIAEWGLGVDRKNIPVDTEKFETCVPGIYAIGDINKYPGKKKLILSGFHEAALAAFAIKERLNPGKKVHLQYTTTSPLMHERLGVSEAD